MNRAQLQLLAEMKIDDAQALLGTARWTAAYYIVGYAVELGLKSCLLRYIDITGMIFTDQKYLRDLSGCWSHDPEKLLALAGLTSEFGVARGANQILEDHWLVVKMWSETSRYTEKTESEARRMVDAITEPVNGIMSWVRQHW